jgi:hypothetical protein
MPVASCAAQNVCFLFLESEAVLGPHLAVTGKTHFCVVVVIIIEYVFSLCTAEPLLILESCYDDQHDAALTANNISNEEDAGWGKPRMLVQWNNVV